MTPAARSRGSDSSEAGPRARGTSGFTAEEREAMKDHLAEVKRAARRGGGDDRAEGERLVLEKIAGMTEPDRTLGRRVHAIIMANAPALVPRLWYGMPAYSREGNVVCHFQNAGKFKLRYATVGFSDEAKLDEGEMWPVVFAVKSLNAAEEARLAALVRRAVG